MTLTLTRPSGPDQDWPVNPPFPPTGPQAVHPEPSLPTPWDPPPPEPRPKLTSLRIGRAPRRSRRQLAVRVFHLCGDYALGWGAFAMACLAAFWDLWVVAVVVLYLASVLCSPWRPRVQRRDLSPALGAGANARRWRTPIRRVGLPSVQTPVGT